MLLCTCGFEPNCRQLKTLQFGLARSVVAGGIAKSQGEARASWCAGERAGREKPKGDFSFKHTNLTGLDV